MSGDDLQSSGQLNPLVKTGLLLVSALGAAALLQSLSQWLLYAGLLIAMVLAIGLWVLNFDKPLARWLHRHPVGRPVVEAICSLTGEPLPLAEPVAEEQAVDLNGFAQALRQRFPHQDDVTGKLSEIISRKYALRQRLKGHAPEPIAVLLLVGKAALGKRTMAIQAGALLFGADHVVTISTEGQPAVVGRAIASAMRRRTRFILLESLEKAGPETIQTVEDIVTRGRFSAPGELTPVDCSAAIFVLIAHHELTGRDGEELARIDWQNPGANVDPLVQLTGLPRALVSHVDAFVGVQLPSSQAILGAVSAMFETRARDFGLSIAVDPQVIGSEVAQVRRTGDFSEVSGRTKKLAEPAIQLALRTQAQRAEVKRSIGDEE